MANLVGAVAGCAEEHAVERVCPRPGLNSVARIVLDRYLEVRGHDVAIFTLCVEGASCSSAELRITDTTPGGVECRSPAVGYPFWCQLDAAGALDVWVRLDGIELETERRPYLLELLQDGVETEVSGSLLLAAQVPYGVECGVTHVQGEVWLDAATLRPIEPG